jgi:predicted nucleotidyltransferase
LIRLAANHTDRAAIGRHYLHLGERQRNTYFADHKTVSLKKIFYALRPAAALRWLRLHPDAVIAPMDFRTLLQQCDPPADVLGLSADLIARKSVTREFGTGPLPAPIRDFIDREFESAHAHFDARPRRVSDDAKSEADALFRSMLHD